MSASLLNTIIRFDEFSKPAASIKGSSQPDIKIKGNSHPDIKIHKCAQEIKKKGDAPGKGNSLPLPSRMNTRLTVTELDWTPSFKNTIVDFPPRFPKTSDPLKILDYLHNDYIADYSQRIKHEYKAGKFKTSKTEILSGKILLAMHKKYPASYHMLDAKGNIKKFKFLFSDNEILEIPLAYKEPLAFDCPFLSTLLQIKTNKYALSETKRDFLLLLKAAYDDISDIDSSVTFEENIENHKLLLKTNLFFEMELINLKCFKFFKKHINSLTSFTKKEIDDTCLLFSFINKEKRNHVLYEDYISKVFKRSLTSNSCGYSFEEFAKKIDSSSVTKLDFSDLSLLRDAHLKILSKKLEKITDLNLTRCSDITDKGLSYLINFAELRKLNLTKCPRITDKGIIEYVSKIPLKELKMRDCVLLTKKIAKALKKASLTSLEVDEKVGMGNKDLNLIENNKLNHRHLKCEGSAKKNKRNSTHFTVGFKENF